MKRNSILALLLPVLAVAFTLVAVPTADAQRGGGGGGGGGREFSRGTSVRGGGDVVTRSGSRDVVTRSGSRGGYYGRGGYGTRYIEPRRHSHSHFSGSIWIGPSWGIWDPFWYPYYPAYRYYSPPATVVVPQEPQEYIQPESQQGEAAFWYYCRNPEGYYPYVERCPSGWMRVVPDTVPPDEEDDADVEDKEK